MRRCRPEGHHRSRNTRMEETSRRQKNGGVFWGRPGPRGGCSAVDGWMNRVQGMFRIISVRRHELVYLYLM